MRTYSVKEIFYSLQGEGTRSGEASIFVRFAGCNLKCEKAKGPKSPGGFDCDTDFQGGLHMTAKQILDECAAIGCGCRWLLLTGGEPLLQVDEAFLREARARNYKLALETNGTIDSGDRFDWIAVSPKIESEQIKQRYAHEVRYVMTAGQKLPKPTIWWADLYLSPAADEHGINPDALAWCIKLVKENPIWKLSTQNHKTWNIQ